MQSSPYPSPWRRLWCSLFWTVALLGLAAPGLPAAVPFSGEQTIITGYTNAWAVETIDFDGDDDPDVMCSAESGIVSWAENTSGDGSTWTRHDLDPSFSRARGVAVGDFDGDDLPDGAAAAWNEDEVEWFRNELDGPTPGFVQLPVDTANYGANDVAAVDVDGDGDLDLFSAGRVSDKFFWNENRLDVGGGWVQHTIATGINAANDVWYGDVDGDGDVDLVGGSASGRGLFGWWENDIGGSSCPGDWCEHVVALGSTLGVFAADLDYDGDVDLLRHQQGVRFSWWENTAGDGSAWTEHVLGPVSGNGFSIEAVDLDLDGDLDVLGTPDGDWFENLDGHAGSWARHSYYDGSDIYDTKPEDVDGDGDVDVVATLRGAGHVSWWENLTCSPGDPDADSDGVPDVCDRCSGFDDKLDADEDGVPDGCDVCPGGNDHVDTDGNDVPDACEGASGNGTLSIDDVTLAEGTSGTTAFSFTVSFGGTVPGGFTVGYSTADGSAVAPGDYASTSGTLAFAGTDGEARTITVPVVGDGVVELDEAFTLMLGTPSSTDVTVSDATGTGTIVNDDSASLSIDDVTQVEGDSGTSGFVFTVTLTGDVADPFTVGYHASDVTAERGTDYEETRGNLSFSGTDGETMTITVPVIGDGVVEPDETFRMELGTPSHPNVSLNRSLGVGTIVNDDSASVSIDDVSQVEADSGTTGFVFTVTLTGEVVGGFTVGYSTSDGTAAAPGDYTSTSGTSTFSGTDGETHTITVPVVGDMGVEPDETFLVTLGTPSNASVTLGDGSGLGTIENDDSASVSIDDVSQAEGSSGTTGFVFTVTLTGEVAGGFTVGYSTSDGTAAAPGDYTSTSGTLTFAGTDGETQTITVPVVGETAVEPDETFTVSLGTPSNGSVTASDGSGQGTIENDDTATLSIDDVSQAEGSSGTAGFVFTVTLSGGVVGGFTVGYSTSDGTASAPGDYTSTSGTLTFAGTDGETQTITVPVVGDMVVEPDETFTVALGTPSNASVTLGDGCGLGTIENDDTATLSIDDVSQAEGDSGTAGFVFTVTLGGEVAGGFTVGYSTADGTASAPGDYTATSGTLTFAGTDGETHTITVPVVGDTTVEPDETFTVALGTPSNGSVTASDDSGLGTIENDDSATIAIDDVSQAEGDSGTTGFVLTVTLTGEVAGGFTVGHSTADGTASAPGDYTSTSGTLTFAGTGGETQTITVPVVGDMVVEPDETFTVALGTPSNASVTLADGTGLGTIENDDSAAILSATKEVVSYQPGLDSLVYRIQIANDGGAAQADDPASDELEDVLPAELLLESAASDSPDFTVTADPETGTVLGNGTIGAGEVVTVTIRTTDLSEPGIEIANQALIRFDSDHDGTDDTTVVSDDPATPEPGDPTIILSRATVVEVPALGGLGLPLFALLLSALGWYRLRLG